jgi:hypothetical protein
MKRGPNCIDCGRKIAALKPKTGRCAPCSYPFRKKSGKLNRPSWNSGISKYADGAEAQQEWRRRRTERRQASPDMADRFRTLIRNSFRRAGLRKDTKTAILLGCSPAEFKQHLERQFTEGMSWENYGNSHGKWNVDHIVPLSAFDLSDRAQQLKAFHHSNCRPLWAIENIKKGGANRDTAKGAA